MVTRTWSTVLALLSVVAVAIALPGVPASASPPDDIVLYLLPAATSFPEGIAAGPDGNMWFTEAGADKIGRITLDGVITEYPVPTAYGSPRGITAGPDGNMWFTEGWGPPGCPPGRVGRITPDGSITEYPLPQPSDQRLAPTDSGSCPRGIAAGPDGNLWFTEYTGNAIGRITPDGTVTEYLLPSYGGPEGIAAGPDGNLWFTEYTGNMIGRITPAGAITEYPLHYGDRPSGIAAGPDGNMWFTETGDPNYSWSGNRIGRITPAGAITEFRLPAKGSRPHGIAAGPDGNLWFTMSGGIGRITPDGAIAEYSVDTAFTSGIAAGPDGNMWFTAQDAVGRISPTATPNTRTCPVNVTLHKPSPTMVGNRTLVDRIATRKTSCALPEPVVLCRPLASTTAGEKAFCDTQVTRRGRIRVTTQGYEAVRVTVIVRATPKRGFAETWKPNTWRRSWVLR